MRSELGAQTDLSHFGPQPVEVLLDRICRENGISHRHTAPRSLTTTGKIERFHQSLRREFLADRTFASLEAAQEALDGWVSEYNTSRPHQALEMATPAERSRLAPLARDAISVPLDSAEGHPGQWVLRRVGSNGMVSVDNQLFSVTNAYKGGLVDVFVDRTVIQVWSKNPSSEPSPEDGRAECGWSEPTGSTSRNTRLRSVKRQPKLDRGHPINRRPGRPR